MNYINTTSNKFYITGVIRPRCDFNIRKLDDEWYLYTDSSYIGGNTYYKCDQFDGLLKLLTDKGFFKKNKNISEGFKTEDYYVRISNIQDDVERLGFNTNYSSLIRFTNREKNLILNTLPNSTDGIFCSSDKMFCSLHISRAFNDFFFYKYGDDGWIWVYNNNSNIAYRCDQIDGVIRFLKDKWKK
jgi:hypothetical protein